MSSLQIIKRCLQTCEDWRGWKKQAMYSNTLRWLTLTDNESSLTIDPSPLPSYVVHVSRHQARAPKYETMLENELNKIVLVNATILKWPVISWWMVKKESEKKWELQHKTCITCGFIGNKPLAQCTVLNQQHTRCDWSLWDHCCWQMEIHSQAGLVNGYFRDLKLEVPDIRSYLYKVHVYKGRYNQTWMVIFILGS